MDTVHVKVFRYTRGDGDDGHFDEFDVPRPPHMTVLEALLWIERHADPTLTVRHSCHHASCGACGVQVDGREALACVTPLEGDITVEPLANLPIVTDLVVDTHEIHGRFHDGGPVLRVSEVLPDAEPPEGHERYLRFEDCIECGLCLSACPVVASAAHYAGPAALAAAERRLEEGADPAGILAWAAGDEGVWRCHAAYECTQACPMDFKPAERIMALRGRLAIGRAR